MKPIRMRRRRFAKWHRGSAPQAAMSRSETSRRLISVRQQVVRRWKLGVDDSVSPLGVRVRTVYRNTPASVQLGLEPGDYILDVQGYPVGYYQGTYYDLGDLVEYVCRSTRLGQHQHLELADRTRCSLLGSAAAPIVGKDGTCFASSASIIRTCPPATVRSVVRRRIVWNGDARLLRRNRQTHRRCWAGTCGWSTGGNGRAPSRWRKGTSSATESRVPRWARPRSNIAGGHPGSIHRGAALIGPLQEC